MQECLVVTIPETAENQLYVPLYSNVKETVENLRGSEEKMSPIKGKCLFYLFI